MGGWGAEGVRLGLRLCFSLLAIAADCIVVYAAIRYLNSGGW